MKRIKLYLKQGLLYAVFIFYLFILAKVTLFKYISPLALFSADRIFSRTINWIPIKSTLNYFSGAVSLKIAFMNVLGNIVIFIPLGIYLQVFKRNKSGLKSMLAISALSLLIEVTQFTFGIGGSDIDDLLLNSLGGLMGICIYKCIARLLKDEGRIKTMIAIGSCLIGVLSFFFINSYYRQLLSFDKSSKLVIMGEEFAVGNSDPDIMGQFISFEDGILTVHNVTGINNRKDRYGDIDIVVKVEPGMKMAKKAVDFQSKTDEIIVTFSAFSYEDFKSLGKRDSVFFDIVDEEGIWYARNICVVYEKDIRNKK